VIIVNTTPEEAIVVVTAFSIVNASTVFSIINRVAFWRMLVNAVIGFMRLLSANVLGWVNWTAVFRSGWEDGAAPFISRNTFSVVCVMLTPLFNRGWRLAAVFDSEASLCFFTIWLHFWLETTVSVLTDTISFVLVPGCLVIFNIFFNFSSESEQVCEKISTVSIISPIGLGS